MAEFEVLKVYLKQNNIQQLNIVVLMFVGLYTINTCW